MSSSRWRWGTPLICLLCGALFPISRASSDGDDLRPGRYTDLAALASAERRSVDLLAKRAAALNKEIASLTAGLQDVGVRRGQRQVANLAGPAGLVGVSGPGVVVTLSDAPEEVRAASNRSPNLLVVHQQDIQAVVNAMWKGGATAIAIEGQRIVSTTGIRCEGNAVLLQGVPYSQPYDIAAVGDPNALRAAIETDQNVALFRRQAQDPTIAIGWEFTEQERVVAPAFDGLFTMSFAKPMTGGDGE
ncbi:MAG: DUF881 domain-containing protein [Nocardioides sp.]